MAVILFAALCLVPGGCGGSSGASHVNPASVAGASATRVTGMVILTTVNNALARAPQQAKAADKSAALAVITECGAVPDGYVPVTDADITVTGEDTTARTDAGGCFSMDIRVPGQKIFTMRKTNSKGGTTIMKKAANVQPGASVRFVDTEAITVITTVSAIVVEQKLEQGEENIDYDAIEDYIRSIETQEDVAAMAAAITASADPDDDSVSDFDHIDAAVISRGVDAIENPVISTSTVSQTSVPSTGGDVTISVDLASFNQDLAVTGVKASLATTGAAAIEQAMTAGDGGTYSATVSLPANTGTAGVVYTLTISITHGGGTVTNYTLDDITVSAASASCGNGSVDSGEDCDDGGESATCDADCSSVSCGDNTTNTTAGEACDDGNTVTETCTYGQTSCTVCNATCQSVAGATSYCGDSSTDAGNGETCDDSNAVTETCTYGQTSCTVCNATCQSVAGATSYCGDGTTDTGNGETCDDGANNGQPGQCNSTCDGTTPSATCGNTVVEYGEDCDDGGLMGGDGCSPTCQDELIININAPISSTLFGYSVASAGDVDGDGKDEILIGARNTDTGGTHAGSVYLYDDDGATLLATINGTVADGYLGESVASAGDVDGDGKAEILIGTQGAGSSYLYDNDGVTLLATFPGNGLSVASAGDIDSDGKPEILIGNGVNVYLYDDDGTTLLATINGVGGEYFGKSVASAGDVDGDGKPEILIGAYQADPGGNGDAGSVFLYDDDASTLLATINGAAAGDNFGYSVASAGDVDGDGKAELLIGARGRNSYKGTVYLYDDDASTLLGSVDGAEDYVMLGLSVASAGDVDSDGRAEIMIGTGMYGDCAYVYDGDGATLLGAYCGDSSTGFGNSVAHLDSDGDGKPEIIVGAYYGNLSRLLDY